MDAKNHKELIIGRLPETGFIRKSQLIPWILPVGNTTLWRMCKDGRFPAPIQLSTRLTVWRVEDVRAWLAEAK